MGTRGASPVVDGAQKDGRGSLCRIVEAIRD
jgi:hypothetical protein